MDSIVFICFNIGINKLKCQEWISSNDCALFALYRCFLKRSKDSYIAALCKGITKENWIGSLCNFRMCQKIYAQQIELNSLNSTSPFLYFRIVLAMSNAGLYFSSLVSLIQPPTPVLETPSFEGRFGVETEKCTAKLGWIQDGDTCPFSLAQEPGHGFLSFKRWQLWVIKLVSSFSYTRVRCKLLHKGSLFIALHLFHKVVYVTWKQFLASEQRNCFPT